MPFAGLCRVNVAEATIDHFFDPLLSSLDLYSQEDLAGHGAQARQNWCGVKFTMPDGPSGPQISVSRTCDLDVGDYDRFVFRASLPQSVSCSVEVTVDGRTDRVIQDAAGIDDFLEYEGSFSGSRLTGITISLSRSDQTVTMANAEWTMVASSEKRPLLSQEWPSFDEDWEGYLLAPEAIDPSVVEPDIGVFFDAQELEAIRKKAGSPAYRDIYRQLCDLAEEHRHDSPELWIGRVNHSLGSRYSRNAHYDGPGRYATFAEAARALAFVGLVERDVELLRTAARIALSHAMSGRWTAWLDDHPMSTFEHRVFQQYRTGVACSFVLDWAGSVLTDYGKHVITCALAEKGLAEIQTAFMRHDYLRTNNQGFFFAWGWIVLVLAIEHRWPHAIEWLEHPKEILLETLERYVLADGGADEGIGYLAGSLTQCLEAVFVYARRTGRDPKDLLPSSLEEVVHYISANISTVPPDGSIVPIADGGRIETPPQRLAIAQLYALFGSDAAAGLYSLLSHWPINEIAAIPGAVFEIIHGPDSLPPADLPVPSFARFPVSGMMSSLRREGGGEDTRSVRIFLTGGKAYGGHSHDDRGSLILELDRQNAVVDGAQLVYSDPQAEVMKFALFHNLLMPGGADDTQIRQINPCPVSTIVEGDGDERNLDVSIDVSGAWEAPVEAASRRITSSALEVFEVADEMALATAGPVTFRLNTLVPFSRTDDGWRLQLEGVALTVVPTWAPSVQRVRRIGVDGAKRPLHQLQLEAPAASHHSLSTLFRVDWA